MSRSKDPAAYAAIAQDTFLFAGLPAAEVASLLATEGVTVEHYEKGGRIASREANVKSLCILLYGAAAVEKRAGDSAMRMSELLPGDLYGAASLFCRDEAYVAEITAEKSVWALRIPETALRRMMRRDERVMDNYIRYLTGRIRFLSGGIDGFLPASVEERLLLFLKNNARGGVCTLPYGMAALAETLSVGRATLYRAMDALAARGAIARDGRRFHINDGGEGK